MTEKRFWILNTLTEYSGIKDKDKLLTFNEVVDLLNELSEENEQLKKEIAHLKNELAYKDQHNTEKFRGIEDWARGGF